MYRAVQHMLCCKPFMAKYMYSTTGVKERCCQTLELNTGYCAHLEPFKCPVIFLNKQLFHHNNMTMLALCLHLTLHLCSPWSL